MRNFRLPRGEEKIGFFDTMAASAYVKMLQHYHVPSHGILVFFLQESKLTSIRAY
jgi:dsDNA-binding SOS-regulon protein